MVQFYALSVFVNIVIGVLLSIEGKSEEDHFLARLKEVLEEKGIKFSLGILSAIIGLFKFLTPTEGDIPVVGDLVPAVTGIVLGGVILLEFFRAKSDVSSQAISKIEGTVSTNRKFIGMAGIIVGILHFLMPAVPII
jgi:purine-cytosine permease-like protein